MSVKELVRNCVAGKAFVKNVKKHHSEKIVNISGSVAFNYRIMKYLLFRIKKYLFINGYNSEQANAKITNMCERPSGSEIVYEWNEMELVTLTNFFTGDVVRMLYANDTPVTKQKLRKAMQKEATKFLIFDFDPDVFRFQRGLFLDPC